MSKVLEIKKSNLDELFYHLHDNISRIQHYVEILRSEKKITEETYEYLYRAATDCHGRYHCINWFNNEFILPFEEESKEEVKE